MHMLTIRCHADLLGGEVEGRMLAERRIVFECQQRVSTPAEVFAVPRTCDQRWLTVRAAVALSDKGSQCVEEGLQPLT